MRPSLIVCLDEESRRYFDAILENFMGILSDKIAAIQTAVAESNARTTQRLDEQAKQIADLTTKVGEAATPEDLAALDKLTEDLKAFPPPAAPPA